MLVPLFKQLAKCLNSSHFQVHPFFLAVIQLASRLFAFGPLLAARTRF